MFFFLLFIILIMLSVAFFTLMERKLMSLNQFRLGPNKNFFMGIIQPILDGLKLFFKNFLKLNKFYLIFYLGPLMTFLISFLIWNFFFYSSMKFKIMNFLILIGLNSYSFILAGWSSFSKFSYLGGIRACSQTVSYEVTLTLVLLLNLFFFNNLNLIYYKEFFFFFFFILILFWMIIILAETNRAPLDFSEGESELISGFNTEFGSLGFIFFMLSEYSMMIFFSFLVSLMTNFFFFFFLLFFIITRSSFPRFRYDFLINLMWFKTLPFICMLFLLNLNFYSEMKNCKFFLKSSF